MRKILEVMDSTGIGGRDSGMNSSWLGVFNQKIWIKTIELMFDKSTMKVGFIFRDRGGQNTENQSWNSDNRKFIGGLMCFRQPCRSFFPLSKVLAP
jgi:hypothetical protein